MLPDSGGLAIKNYRLKAACDQLFQRADKVPSFCGQCGSQLVFVPETATLGKCECGHEYSEADLGKSFCSDCSTPINIDEKIREDLERVRSIQALLSSVSDFQRYGYLPAS
jgi:hypothetical protein